MKRVICYIKTIFEVKNFIQIYLNTGAVYVAHDYYEEKESIDENGRLCEILVCRVCGQKSVGYYYGD